MSKNFLRIDPKFFLDTDYVKDRLDDGYRRALIRVGANNRSSMKFLLKRRPGKKGNPSKPGKPPKKRTGLLEENVLFGLDDLNGKPGVITGPRILNQSKSKRKTIPNLLDGGGTVTGVFREEIPERLKRNAQGKFIGGKEKYIYKRKTVTYAARPYREPVGKKNKERNLKAFSNIIRRY